MSKQYFVTSIGWLNAVGLEVFPLDPKRVEEDADEYTIDVAANTEDGADISIFHMTRLIDDKPVATFRLPLESLVLLGRWALTLDSHRQSSETYAKSYGGSAKR